MFFDREQLKQENQIHFFFYFPFWNLQKKFLKKVMVEK